MTVYTELKNAIRTGVYCNGDKLPGENELTEQYGVSRQTIRQALEMLREEQLIVKTRGSGTFVQQNAPRLNTKRVAVIAYSITESVFPAMLSGIEAVLSENNYSTMIFANNDNVMRERQILKQLCEDPVDGILLCAVESVFGCANLDLIRQLQNMGTKFVFLGIRYPDKELEDIPGITMDDYEGVYQITRQMIGRGYRNVGGVFSQVATHLVERIRAVRQAVIDAGLNYDKDAFLITNSPKVMYREIEENAGRVLINCDLLICTSGVLADTLIEAMQKVPSAAVKAIVILDETEHLPCEGVQIHMYKGADKAYGRECAEKLLRMIAGKQEPSLVFPWIEI